MTPVLIIARTSEVFGVPAERITGLSKAGGIVSEARTAAMWVLRDQGWGLQDIATYLGRLDHTTVLYYLRKGDTLAGDPRWLRKLKKVAQV